MVLAKRRLLLSKSIQIKAATDPIKKLKTFDYDDTAVEDRGTHSQYRQTDKTPSQTKTFK